MAGIVHVKKRLTDISTRFPSEQAYCGADFFPLKQVENLSDFITHWSKANILRLDELAISAPDDELPPEVELQLQADDSYNCRMYAVRAPDKVITKRNADPAIDYDVERTLHCRARMDIRLEYLRVKQILRSTSFMTNNQTLNAAQRFDNNASGSNDPVATIRNIVTQMRLLNGGNGPNVIRMTSIVKNAIVQSESWKDYTKFNVVDRSAPIGDEALMDAVFGVAPGTVKTSDATYNAATAGATASYKTFLGSDIVFAYKQAPGLRTYGLGTEFRFSGYNTDPYAILSVPQFQRGPIPGEDIRAITLTDPKILNTDSGFLLKGCVDTSNTAYGGFVD